MGFVEQKMALKCLLACVFYMALLLSARAHHAEIGIDTESLVEFEGRVTEFSWRNPHVYIVVNLAKDETEWTVQTSSTLTMTRVGWNRDSLSVGDYVTVRASPAQDGRSYGILRTIEKEGGIVLPTSFDSDSGEPLLNQPEVTALAETMSGRWRADTSKLDTYPGGFDGFFHANMNLTEKGRISQRGYNALSFDNPASRCIGPPAPALIIYTNLYPLEIQINDEDNTVVFRTEYFDELRTVYMDGREHPDSGVRFPGGHSIGRWEGDVLTVETRLFSDHRSPYQIGVPSGSQKHLVERYQLIDGGARLTVEFVLEDPEYMLEPLTHTRELIYSPEVEMVRFGCNQESTQRFVPG
jgi:hypothetical protein